MPLSPHDRILSDAFDQLLMQTSQELADEALLLEARAAAKRRLEQRLTLFMTGLVQMGFSPSFDRGPGGRLTLTVDPDAWTLPDTASDASERGPE